MNRIPEPEMMETVQQAQAYASADLSCSHKQYTDLFRKSFPGLLVNGRVLDLGCGTADITIRFARTFPECRIDGIDGAREMLKHAEFILSKDPITKQRIKLLYGRIPEISPPQKRYQVIISNSLLHHMSDPSALWTYIMKYAATRCAVFIMDLRRPVSESGFRRLVKFYGKYGSEFFRQDFCNSLRAAYRVSEVKRQLRQAGLYELNVRAVGDRHLTVAGFLYQS